jgi:hypothetical protein
MNAGRTRWPVVLPSPVFTLGSALRWLGHECRDLHYCWEPVRTLTASVWFLRRGPHFSIYSLETLILLDPTEVGKPLACTRRLIDEVGRCSRGDAIQVRHRRGSDNGWMPVLQRVSPSHVSMRQYTDVHRRDQKP